MLSDSSCLVLKKFMLTFTYHFRYFHRKSLDLTHLFTIMTPTINQHKITLSSIVMPLLYLQIPVTRLQIVELAVLWPLLLIISRTYKYFDHIKMSLKHVFFGRILLRYAVLLLILICRVNRGNLGHPGYLGQYNKMPICTWKSLFIRKIFGDLWRIRLYVSPF